MTVNKNYGSDREVDKANDYVFGKLSELLNNKGYSSKHKYD